MRKGQVSLSEIDPIAGRIIFPLVMIFVVTAVGVEITGQMVEKSHEIELDKCQEKFGSNFSNGTLDGEYVCMKDGEVYNPDVHALNSETGNPLADMIVIPFNFLISLPWWIQIPLGILVFILGLWAQAVIGPR